MKNVICIAIVLAVLLAGCGQKDSYDFYKIHVLYGDKEAMELNSEQDLLDALEMVKSSELEFRFFCSQGTDLSLFDRMLYSKISESSDPYCVVLTVPYDDIDLEVLKELSQRIEITSIRISRPYYMVPE